MHPEDNTKTAIVTPSDLYEFLCMPLGLKNTAQTFQHVMDSVLQGPNCIFIYHIASSSDEEYLREICSVCCQGCDFDFVFQLEERLFGLKTINFLGHQLSKHGSILLPSKFKAQNKGNHSKQHCPPESETRYSTFDCEFLELYMATTPFKFASISKFSIEIRHIVGKTNVEASLVLLVNTIMLSLG